MYKGGYTGKVLRVDLTTKTFKEEPLPVEVAQDFIGGSGFTVKFLYDEVPADCDPLGPENKLIYAPGPFTGTTVPCASRMAINAKSPATGAMGVATTGGHFPVEMKRAGYDVIIVEGKAEAPTYLWIKNGEVKFRDAKELWGLHQHGYPTGHQGRAPRPEHPHQLHRARRARSSRRWPASSTSAGWPAARAWAPSWAARTSRPSLCAATDLAIADKEKYDAARKRMLAGMRKSPILYPEFSRYGTSTTLDLTQALGIYPAKNWTATGVFNPADKIGGYAIEIQGMGKTACAGCPVGCSQLRMAQTGPTPVSSPRGPNTRPSTPSAA